MKPNIRASDTGVTHGNGYRHERTVCGLRYIRDGQYIIAGDNSPVVFDTEAEIDCMACIATPCGEHTDIHEVIIANSVKDMLEAEDERASWLIRKDPT